MAVRRYASVDICLLCLCLWVAVCETKRSYVFKMPGTYCNSKRREIDGALIRSSSNPLYTNSACTLKFKADSYKLWINFESWLVTDCDLKLKLFFTQSYSISSPYYNDPDMVLDCHSKPTSFVTPSRYLTMRLEKLSNTGYSFRIVLTSYKQKSNWSCPKSHCGSEMMCVDRDVWCDGVRNCPNGTDETNCHLFSARRNRNSGGMLLGGILMLFGMVIVALVLLVWCRRRRATRGQVLDPPPGGYTMQQQPLYQQQPMRSYLGLNTVTATTMPGFDRTMPAPQPPMFPTQAPMPPQSMATGPPMYPPAGMPPQPMATGPPMYPPAGMPPQMTAPYPPQGPPPPYESIVRGPAYS